MSGRNEIGATKVHANDSVQTSINPDMQKSGGFDLRTLMDKTVKGMDPEEATYGSKGHLEYVPPRMADAPSDDNNYEGLFAEDGESATPEETTATEAGNGKSKTASEPSDSTSLSKELEKLSANETDSKSTPTGDSVTGNIEEMYVKGANGRREKLKIDYTDRQAIKDAHVKAAGMRKFQAERDEYKKKAETVEKEHTQLKADFGKLEAVWEKDGVKGLVTLLAGEKGMKELVDAELAHRDYMSNLTPDEKYKLEIGNYQKLLESQKTATEEKYKKLLDDTTRKNEEATMRSMESKLHPSFDRYRFSGKLGDAAAEHRLDKALWEQTIERLGEYPEEVELTQAIVDREFRAAATDFKKMINVQADRKVRTTIENKKADAASRVQTTAKKGISNVTDKQKFVNDLRSGNVRDAMSSLFAGKVKL